jgi:hypothetical protein
MHGLEHLSTMIALLLAVAAALVSSDSEARKEVASLFAEVLKPQAVVELGADPGYLLGTSKETPSPRLDRVARTN